MVAKVAQTMNNSARSFADLEKLAKQAPHIAKSYLKEVSVKLKEFGQVGKAKQIEDLLDDKDLVASLHSRATSLGKIFPKEEGGYAAVQAARVQTMGWQSVEENKIPATTVTGKIKIETDPATFQTHATLTTENGRKLNLVPHAEMALWLKGMVDDGPITVKGKLDVNGNFKMHGFALNRDGKFDTLTFGRVQVSDKRVYITTSDGEVDVTNPELKKKLANLHMLGIILPGNPEKHGSKLKYDKDPAEFFALGRFTDQTVKNAEGAVKGKHVLCDMAYSKFASQPFVLPKGQESRADHSGRFWALGDFKYLREKKTEYGGETLGGQFVASYLSKQSDDINVSDAAASDADAVQAAVMLAEADDDLPAKQKAATAA